MPTDHQPPPAAPRLILAPLRGFTDHVFRNLFHRHFGGFDAALAPFIPAVTADGLRPAHLRDVLPENNAGPPLVPQLLGNRPQDFIAVCRVLHAMGHAEVNWNLGCPYPMVAKKLRGCGLLPHPERIEAFLEAVLPELPVALSVKLRLGRYEAREIAALIPVLNRYPLAEITLHPRTGRQMYGGRVDLEAFEDCLAALEHPVVYNGDITTAAVFEALRERFGGRVAGWMIGRGALCDPFLPSAIKAGGDGGDDRPGRFRGFYEELFEAYRREFQGPGHLLNRMKEFWTYFSQAFEDGGRLRKQVHRAHRLERYEQIVAAFFESGPAWRVSRT